MTWERAGKLGSAEGAALTSEAQGRLQRCYPTVASGVMQARRNFAGSAIPAAALRPAKPPPAADWGLLLASFVDCRPLPVHPVEHLEGKRKMTTANGEQKRKRK